MAGLYNAFASVPDLMTIYEIRQKGRNIQVASGVVGVKPIAACAQWPHIPMSRAQSLMSAQVTAELFSSNNYKFRFLS